MGHQTCAWWRRVKLAISTYADALTYVSSYVLSKFIYFLPNADLLQLFSIGYHFVERISSVIEPCPDAKPTSTSEYLALHQPPYAYAMQALHYRNEHCAKDAVCGNVCVMSDYKLD